MNNAHEPWDRQGYADVVAVDAAADGVLVRFADGDEIEVRVEALGLGPMAEFSVAEETGALVAADAGEEREIDWMVLRSLSDPAFAEEVRRRDAEEAHRIGRRLRALRENRGISQKAAANMAGMSAPQLSKLERGETDMRLSTVRTLLRGLGASLADISGPDAPEVSTKELAARAKRAGVPAGILERIVETVAPGELAAAFARAFGWEIEALIEGVPETPELDVQVAFNTRSKPEDRRSPLLRLARTVSEISAAQARKVTEDLPSDPAAIRKAVIDDGGRVSLAGLVRWAWRMGIIVVPMAPGPGFSAVAWFVEKRPVIVIKTAPNLMANWLFHLAHEIGHIVLGHVAPGAAGEQGLVDVEKPSLSKALSGSEGGAEVAARNEDEANQFALDLLIPNRESIFAEIRRRSGDTLQQQKRTFKFKAEAVANEANLNVPLVTLAAAYSLTDVAGQRDRWGSAINAAKDEGEARPIVVPVFEEGVSLDGLSELDAALVRAVVLE